MIETELRDADPARDLDPDARSVAALAMLARIVASPRGQTATRRRAITRVSVRRIAVGGVLAGAAATVALAVPMPWDESSPGTTTSAYAVTTDSSGAVHVSVRWDRLGDPAALQAALDRADARVKVLIRTDQPGNCLASAHVVGYSSDAVHWQSPGTANGGFTVRPVDFPAGATFVLAVDMAPADTHGQSTFAPGQPQMEGFSASMVVGSVPTACAP